MFRRFYRRVDLEKDGVLTPTALNFMAENEVFETNCTSRLSAAKLVGKCYVWSIDKYDSQAEVGLDDYYTRAKYDVVLVTLRVRLKLSRRG